jgi:tRNA (mo5U34)-methyltransferase
MYDHAKWLLLDDILRLLEESGFDPVTVVERREERNGPRVTILAGPRAT